MTMIERVEEAIADAIRKNENASTMWLEAAKAAIAAMREPSEGMKHFEAADGNIFDWNAPCSYCGGNKFAVEAYIDAALKE